MKGMPISTKTVLTVIGTGAFIVISTAVPSIPIALGAIYKEWKNVTKSDLGRIIKRLEKQEMISIRETNGRISITITEKGEKRLLEYDYENLKLTSKKRDGKWRLVIFDIPEESKKIEMHSAKNFYNLVA